MSFTAKDPNRKLWRLEERPDLKQTQAPRKNARDKNNIFIIIYLFKH